jgi:hypothetical protein
VKNEEGIKEAKKRLIEAAQNVETVIALSQQNKDLRTALRAKDADYRALFAAVAWEREFDEVLVWLVQTGRYPRDMDGKYVLANERECARAEVDRLLGVHR